MTLSLINCILTDPGSIPPICFFRFFELLFNDQARKKLKKIVSFVSKRFFSPMIELLFNDLNICGFTSTLDELLEFWQVTFKKSRCILLLSINCLAILLHDSRLELELLNLFESRFMFVLGYKLSVLVSCLKLETEPQITHT